FDDIALATDYEGHVYKFTFTGSTFTGATLLFDASAWYHGVNGAACPTGTACQPISTSVSIVRRLAGAPQFIGLFGTGGASWTSTASGIDYKIYGIDVTGLQLAPFLTLSPGTAATPLGTLPLRVYAAPTISGSDVFTNVTTLAIDSNNQMMLPYQHP